MAAHAPGMQITPIPSDLTMLTMFSPGSQIPGIPASLTIAIDLPAFNSAINFGILFKEFSLLKLIKLLEMLNLFIIFLVCLVSSQAMKETFARILIALGEISFKFPIGVPTKYKIPSSGSSFL